MTKIRLLLALTFLSFYTIGHCQQPSPYRILHIPVPGVEYSKLLLLIDKASTANFNTIILGINHGVFFKNTPWRQTKLALSVDQFVRVANYAKEKGLRVIPAVSLLTHQNWFQYKQKFVKYKYNKSTYDPQSIEFYENAIFPFLDEIISAIQPSEFLIGHDEVAGFNKFTRKKWLRKGEKMLPAKLFLRDVNLIYNYLKQRNIETWMWGDMLLTADEFPSMSVHESIHGYGKPLRDKLPRDIVICDWHYFNEQTEFPTLSRFKQEGFRVIGSTWHKEETIRNFSHYASVFDADGMMATTWIHALRKDWDVIDEIIHTSGAVYLENFPDVK